jgi:hypothetical protein
MTNKIQGEGDYESARRYNRNTADSVKKGVKKPDDEAPLSQSEMDAAEQAGKQRAKKIEHDKTDAELMKEQLTTL